MNSIFKTAGVAAAMASTTLLAASSFSLPATAKEDYRACFRVQNIEGIAPAENLGAARDRDGVNIKMQDRSVYQAELLQPCPELQDSIQIGVVSRSGSSYICRAEDTFVVARSRLAPANRCTVSSLRKLTNTEVASIPKGQRP